MGGGFIMWTATNENGPCNDADLDYLLRMRPDLTPTQVTDETGRTGQDELDERAAKAWLAEDTKQTQYTEAADHARTPNEHRAALRRLRDRGRP